MANVVLLVENHEDSREALRMLLELDGHVVVAFADGEAVLAALHDMPVPCVIVLELWLPSMSGLDLIRRVHAITAFAAVPVIVITSAYRAAENSGLPFLLKPVDPEVILSAVRQHCACGPPPATA